MAAYIDADYVDYLLTEDVRVSVFTDNGVYNTAAFNQHVTLASERVLQAAAAAGFSLGTTTTNEMVKLATYGQLLLMMDGRRGFIIEAQMWQHINSIEDIRTGKIPLDAESTDGDMTVGAASFTSSDPDDSSGIATGDTKPQLLKRLRLLF